MVKFYAKFDLTESYWQMKCKPEYSDLLSFRTTQGCYKFLVAPMGFCSSAATFQRSIDSCLNGIEGVIAYQDDILVFAETWEQYCRIVRQVLVALRMSSYYCNPAKTEIGVRSLSVEFLGHRIGYGEKTIQESKILATKE